MSKDGTPGGFGSRLREARERRAISLREIANATKISMSALEALERNDISRLPGGIFSRAFVRSYAAEVGLDPEQTIQEFIAQFPQDSVTAGHPTSERVSDGDALESDRRMASTFLRLIAISVPVAGIVLYFGMAGRQARPSAPFDGVAAATAAQTASLPPPPLPPDLAVASTSSAAAVETTPPAFAEPMAARPASSSSGGSSAPAALDRLTVGLSATRACWVSATVDGQKATERVMQAGERLTLDVRREIELTAADPSSIGVTLNGAVAKPLGQAGKAVTVRLDLTNFQEYLSAR